jgi:hypothetical protein
MLWSFERDDESLKLETRYHNDTSEFIVIVRYPDGHEHSERFTAGDTFRQWLEAFEQNLVGQRWTGRSGPVILPYGWPNKRLT